MIVEHGCSIGGRRLAVAALVVLAWLIANWDSIAKIIEYLINLWAKEAPSVEQAAAAALVIALAEKEA